jgi:esterase/lipase
MLTKFIALHHNVALTPLFFLSKIHQCKVVHFIHASVITLMMLAASSQALALTYDESSVKNSEQITPSYKVMFKARQDRNFLLAADYIYHPEKASSKQTAGVLVLHGCRDSRENYHILSQAIADQGLHVLSLDFRGYGESVAPGYSELEIKKQAADIVTYQSDIALLTSYWSADIVAAYEYLRKKVDNSKGISVVASGCAGAYAVELAEQRHLYSMVLLTPQMAYADKERYKNLIDIPSYFISSAQHAMSYATAEELFTWSGDKRSKLQVYKGDKLNYQVINAHKYLVNDIALWLKSTLR